MVSAILISHGQVLIWQARDGEIYMDALSFEKDDLKNADSIFRVSFVLWWVVSRGKYYIDGPNDEYPVENYKLCEFVVGTSGDSKTVLLWKL
jgi:hypothetical protein